MPEPISADEILLREYAEAGSACRHIEQLVRTSLSLFTPAALAGYLVGGGTNPSSKFALSVAGLLVSLLLLNTVIRSQAYYKAYIERAKRIESLIERNGAKVLSLYTGATGAPTGTSTMPNKSAIGLVMVIAAIYFTVSLIAFGYWAWTGV